MTFSLKHMYRLVMKSHLTFIPCSLCLIIFGIAGSCVHIHGLGLVVEIVIIFSMCFTDCYVYIGLDMTSLIYYD